MSKRKLDFKFVKHAHRKAFYEYLRGKGRDKFTLSHVYWYMYLRSGKGNVFHLADELAAGDLGMDIQSLRVTRRTLKTDGWVECNRPNHQGVPDWIVSTDGKASGGKATSGKPTTAKATSGFDTTAVVVHLQEALNPNASTSPSAPNGVTPSSVASEKVSGAFNPHEENETETRTLVSEDKDKTNPNPEDDELEVLAWSEVRGAYVEEIDAVEELEACFPVFKHATKPASKDKRQMAEVIARLDGYAVLPSQCMEYARKHKQSTPGLIPRSPQGLWDAICGAKVSATNSLAAQTKDHDPATCGLCVKELNAKPCDHCNGSTWNKPVVVHGRVYCQECMKLPPYRRESGQHKVMTSII